MHQSTLLVGQISIKLVDCTKTIFLRKKSDFMNGYKYAIIIILPTLVCSWKYYGTHSNVNSMDKSKMNAKARVLIPGEIIFASNVILQPQIKHA